MHHLEQNADVPAGSKNNVYVMHHNVDVADWTRREEKSRDSKESELPSVD